MRLRRRPSLAGTGIRTRLPEVRVSRLVSERYRRYRHIRLRRPCNPITTTLPAIPYRPSSAIVTI